jgi:hypothetical protein
LDRPYRCPGKRAGAEDKKGGIKPSPFHPASFPQRDAGGKGRLGNKAHKPALGKEEPPPFLARRMLFCPGMGPLGHRGNLLFAEPIENTPFPEKRRLFFSTKLEMIHNKESIITLSRPYSLRLANSLFGA